MSTQHTDRVKAAELSCGHVAEIAYNTALLHRDSHPVICHQCPGRPTVLIVDAMATYPMRDSIEITASYA